MHPRNPSKALAPSPLLLPTAVAWCLLFVSPTPGAAQAAESAECARLRAEAASRAALMFAPTVRAELVRLPESGDDTGEGRFQGTGPQVRGSLGYSVLDAWRGVTIVDAADRTCEELAAHERITRWLASAADAAERAGLRARIDALSAAMPTVERIEARAEDLLERRLSTLSEVDGLLASAGRLRRALVRAESALAQLPDDLEARDPDAIAADLHAYLAAAEARAADEARLRKLRAWDLRVRGGVIPQEQVDWYGGVELEWNVGSLFQGDPEGRAAAAQREALRSSPNGLVERVRRLEERLAQTAALIDDELRLLEAEEARTARRQAAVEANDAAVSVAARDAIGLRLIEIRSERAYLEALRASHAPFARPRSVANDRRAS